MAAPSEVTDYLPTIGGLATCGATRTNRRDSEARQRAMSVPFTHARTNTSVRLSAPRTRREGAQRCLQRCREGASQRSSGSGVASPDDGITFEVNNPIRAQICVARLIPGRNLQHANTRKDVAVVEKELQRHVHLRSFATHGCTDSDAAAKERATEGRFEK